MHKLLLLAGIGAALGICGCAFTGEGGLPQDAPTLYVTDDEVHRELLDNPVRANDRYSNSKMVITGVVSAILDDLGDGKLSISLGETRSIMFRFRGTPENREKIGKLNVGSIATFEGVYRHEVDIDGSIDENRLNRRVFSFEGFDIR